MKRSINVCMHIKIMIFCVAFFMNKLIAQNQKNHKWGKYIASFKTEKDTATNSYFLVTKKEHFSQNICLLGDDKTLRVLDAENIILKSSLEHISEYKNIVYKKANNLWKLALFRNIKEEEQQFFSIKTRKPTLLMLILESLHIPIVYSSNDLICVSSNLKKIRKNILHLNYVSYISNENLKPVPESVVEDLDLSVNGFLKAKTVYPNLTGDNKIIGLKDNFPNESDIDLLGKLIETPVGSLTTDQHATDMATIIAGNGNSGVNGFGIVHNASIFPMDFNNLFPNEIAVLNSSEVSLINNSYGTSIENFYGTLAEAYDQFLYENPTKLHVFSSGNSGQLTSENGIYQNIPNYANLTGNFKMSKNIITVGAVDQNQNVLPFSSKGPAYDGRVKPEIVAYSVIGTSNACALVTGAASMIQQAYEEKEGELPPAALIKAALLNGADDIGRPGVDFESGYGNLNVLSSLDCIVDGNHIQDTVTLGETKSFDLSLPENATSLKVMLVWTDVPALPNDNIALKNNLDLSLSANEKTYLPSILNITPNLEGITSVASAGVDNLNPVEQISISELEETVFTINVSATNLVTEKQQFSVVYSYEIENTFEWIFPLEGNNFPHNENSLGAIKWKANYSNAPIGLLEVSYDDTGSWEIISNTIPINSGLYHWEFPEELHTIARFRLTVNEDVYVSEAFIISSGLQVNTILNCDNSIQINWNKKANVTNYTIFNLQNSERQMIATTTDTSFAFTSTDYPSPYYYVQPQLNDGANSLSSTVLNTSAFSGNCYFNTIFPSLIDNSIQLEVGLNSFYDIATIELYRVNTDNSLTKIISEIDTTSFAFSVMDNAPLEGVNVYQFKITTNTGNVYFSENTNIFYFSENDPFIVFPNPANSEKGISIFSDFAQGEQAVFELLDLNGNLVIQEIINSDRAFINLSAYNLSKGLHIFNIRGFNVDVQFRSKILIE